MQHLQRALMYLTIIMPTWILTSDKPYVCIFDINRSFSYIDRMALMQHIQWQDIYENIGLSTLWSLSSDSFQTQGISRMQREILSALADKDTPFSQREEPVTYYEGQTLPSVLREWILGHLTDKQAECNAHDLIKYDILQSSHLSTDTKALAQFIIRLIFSTEKIAKSLRPNSAVLKLIRRLRANNVTCVIFANTRNDIMKKAGEEDGPLWNALSCIDASYTAEERGLMRPQTGIIDFIAQQYDTPQDHCIMIENEIPHLDYVRHRSYKCILYKHNVSQLIEDLGHYLPLHLYKSIKKKV